LGFGGPTTVPEMDGKRNMFFEKMKKKKGGARKRVLPHSIPSGKRRRPNSHEGEYVGSSRKFVNNAEVSKQLYM
jgi:hypothetical protein